jgi:hypothetical protein
MAAVRAGVDALVYNELVFEEGLRDHVLYLLLCLCLPPAFVWLERQKVRACVRACVMGAR